MEIPQRYLCVVTIFLTALLNLANSYTITVDAHAEECFFEHVEANTKMSLTFEIAEGGFLDIDVTITAPDGSVIYKGERESSGLYTFSASTSGRYTYCFSNKMSTMTPKVVMFNLEVGDAPSKTSEDKDDDPNHNKLEDMIKELASTLKTVKHEQEYMQVRDKTHRSINESTNSRVVMWSVFEASVLLVMTVSQVYYLKRFFEVQRVV